MWQKPSLLKAIRLGVIIGLSFYTDGYFILIGAVLLIAFWLSSLGYGLFALRKRFEKVKTQLACLAVASVTALVALLPLVWIKLHYAPQINSFLGNVRGDIAYDAQAYSAQLYMYFKPTIQ